MFSKDNVLDSIIQVFGFDKKADKFIMAELIKSSQVIEICSTWFTSNEAGEILIINPDKATLKYKFEFKTPSNLVQTALYGDKIVKVVTGVKLK
jgi:predicted naringenin-chalcone synthase